DLNVLAVPNACSTWKRHRLTAVRDDKLRAVDQRHLALVDLLPGVVLVRERPRFLVVARRHARVSYNAPAEPIKSVAKVVVLADLNGVARDVRGRRKA